MVKGRYRSLNVAQSETPSLYALTTSNSNSALSWKAVPLWTGLLKNMTSASMPSSSMAFRRSAGS